MIQKERMLHQNQSSAFLNEFVHQESDKTHTETNHRNGNNGFIPNLEPMLTFITQSPLSLFMKLLRMHYKGRIWSERAWIKTILL